MSNIVRDTIMLKIVTTSLLTVTLLLSFNVAAEAPNNSWTKIFKFQTKMAERGSVNAQYILGEMYEEGRGVEKSNAKAIQWYEKAQRNGHQDAAIRITQIKLRIANEKLEKKAPKQKTKPKKQDIVKTKPAKQLSPKKKSLQANAVKLPISNKTVAKKEAIAPTPPKAKRPHTSPNNLERGKGTHLDVDESESPFE